jgi:isopenicillin-N N-acyltransferase like protein
MIRISFAFAGVFLLSSAAAAEPKPFHYPEQKHGKGELRYINEIPVLTVEGTPEEIGDQIAVLAGKPADRIQQYPREAVFAQAPILGRRLWKKMNRVGETMLPQFPKDHRREFDAMVRAGMDREMLIGANTLFDVKNDNQPLLRRLFGCSTVLIDADHSATGGPLFGRNLDYATLGYLEQYTLVTIYRPHGKHAFASIGFPGVIGSISGMNEKGLSLATLDVYVTNDKTTSFDSKGTPYALCYRRILEECATVEEARKLLLGMKRATIGNLTISDQKTSAVFEVTPEAVEVRQLKAGVCCCTNHFCSEALKPSGGIEANSLERLDTLEKVRKIQDRKITSADVHKQLDLVHHDQDTLQTMIFEPAALRLHLGMGKCPSTRVPLRLLELGKLFH